jgi:CheY-like chemotaxis protein
VGKGSHFAVWLPLRKGTQASIVPQAAIVSEERFALVVEDNDQAAELIRLLLEAEGFTVLRAASAETALLLAPLQFLSLIALEIRLPGMDGWEFLQHIRDDSSLARVPIVVIGGASDEDMALINGASSVMQKPISRARLSACLGELGLSPKLDRTYTILVVDDDPKAVEMIAAFLPAPAYSVVRAYGGGEAIKLAPRLNPDLILLDLMMPEINGFDVVDALRQSPDTARIPILVVTSKQVSPEERATLNGDSCKVIRVIEKSGLNKVRFIVEVRRALADTQALARPAMAHSQHGE